MIKINASDRTVETISTVNVENDKDVVKLEFQCADQVTPELKLSECDKMYVNYQNGNVPDRYLITDLAAADQGAVNFSWTLGRNAVRKSGQTYFVVCAQKLKANGEIDKEWNTVLTSFKVKRGLETMTQPETPYQDIFSQIFKDLAKKLVAENIIAGQHVTLDFIGNNIIINSEGGTVDAYTKAETDELLSGKQDKGNYATSSELAAEERIRQDADNNLQSQIDAITLSSDVVDVVGTYADLQNYDTQHIKANDVIKVLQDSTHNDAQSYYRWVITQNVSAWVYVGSEGPFYTKAEADALLQAKQNIDLIAEYTESNGVYTCNKTFAQISAAYNNGQNIVAKLALTDGYYILSLTGFAAGQVAAFSIGSFDSGIALIHSYSDDISYFETSLENLLYSSNIKQTTGTSASDVMSQNAVTEALAAKKNNTAEQTITDNSTVALADNTDYTGTGIASIAFTFPNGNFECYISLTTASSGTIAITFPNDAKWIGEEPTTYENSKQYEFSVKNGVIVAGVVE